mmetsp:Transcript_17221/g.47124  ORF Transcript_17221/g.47124 Transcript_17221/m.47124 type:complete len:191 (-) Transcript_17221:86-658(-)
MKDLSYANVSIVIDLWEACRSQSDSTRFDEEFGEATFQKLFRNIKTKEDPETVARFQTFAKHFGCFVGTLLSTLGPDTNVLKDVLHNVARQYLDMGITKAGSRSDDGTNLLMSYLGDAMIMVIEDQLQRDLTIDEETALDDVYCIVSQEVRRAIHRQAAQQSQSHLSAIGLLSLEAFVAKHPSILTRHCL